MDMQPGQIIIPHGDGSEEVGAQPPAAGAPPQPDRPEQALPPAPAPAPPAEPAAPPFVQAAVPPPASFQNQTQSQSVPASAALASLPPAEAPQSSWPADAGMPDAHPGSEDPPPGDISWTAAEFTGHQKTVAWYGLVVVGGLLLAALYYWIARDVVFTTVIVLVIIMAAIYASHKPRSEAYHLSPQGLQIGGRVYGFHQFKNFSVTDDGLVASVVFAPLGRVALPIIVSVPSDIEDKVLDYLSFFLPFEEHRTDAIDGLLRRIKF